MTHTRAVIFDLDDTLFDDNASMRAGLLGVARPHTHLAGRHPDELLGEYKRVLGEFYPAFVAGQLSLAEYRARRFERLHGLWGIEGVPGDVSFEAFRTAYQAARQAVPGGLELLRALRERGVKVGILTNFIRPEQQAKLDACGLTPWVDALVTTSEAPPKPDPGSYAAILTALEVQPNEAVMVGDSWENDVVGARAAGMRAVWFERWGGEVAEADVPVVRDFAPLEAALRALLEESASAP
ncbi:HAD family hydrolase [Deinococcus hopiensis]|uniref:HAD family hydrolase n=1 Tax=Deinococcus hopiensis TaxID=309885 RepID=UPI00148379B9|nr:HAD family hydrolase [Deinococcus hopiensis]